MRAAFFMAAVYDSFFKGEQTMVLFSWGTVCVWYLYAEAQVIVRVTVCGTIIFRGGDKNRGQCVWQYIQRHSV